MMCAMFIILVAFASVKMAFDSVPLALFSRASGLIGTEYTDSRGLRLSGTSLGCRVFGDRPARNDAADPDPRSRADHRRSGIKRTC